MRNTGSGILSITTVSLAALCAGLAAGASLAAAPTAKAPEAGTTEVIVKGEIRPKPAAAEAPPPLEIYARLPKFEAVALSPDGDNFAFVTTNDDLHILATYRFSDKSKQAVKLSHGAIAGIAWADDDHVLIDSMRVGLRGTCGGGNTGTGGAALTGIVIAAQAPSGKAAVAAMMANGNPSGAAEKDITTALLDSLKIPDCVYFGVRSQNAVTSVDIATQTGVSLGEHLGENANLPLGRLQPVTIAGKTQLSGPFLELRTQSVNREPTERVYLWNVDAKTGTGKMVVDGGPDIDRINRYVDDWVVGPDGTLLARAVYHPATTNFTIEMKVKGAWKAVLTRKIVNKNHVIPPYLAGIGRDGASIVIVDTPDGDSGKDKLRTFHYYELSPTGTLSAPLEPNDAAHDRPLFDPVTGRLQGFVSHGESDTYTFYDPALQALYQKALDALPGEAVRIAAVAQDPHKMIIYAQGGNDPGAYYAVDLSTGHSEAVGEDYADLPTQWVASQSAMTYKAADGMDIHALLTLPPKPDGKNLPLVVLPHDGPEAHDSLGFDWLAQALASRGYAVLQPNYRGSDGYGRAYMEAGYSQWGRKMSSDLDDGVKALVAQGVADPKRVCVVGIGYGGYAALKAASDPNTYRCAAAINGISDLPAYADWQKGRLTLPEQDATTSLIPDPQWPRAFKPNPGSPQIFNAYLGSGATSPAGDAGHVFTPVLLVHEKDDPVVPLQQSQTMNGALQRLNKPVELVQINGKDHSLGTSESRLAALNALTAFLAKNNPAN